jgi:hypothetical protein
MTMWCCTATERKGSTRSRSSGARKDFDLKRLEVEGLPASGEIPEPKSAAG